MPASPSQLKITAPPAPMIDLQALSTLSDNLEGLMGRIREVIFKPDRTKVAPSFSLPQLAALCGVSDDTMLRRLEKASERGLPPGTLPPASTERSRPRRVFSVADAQEWVRAEGVPFVRPAGVRGCTIAVGNFKGGVGKTTLTMCLAQGLSLRGYKVGVIDLDPQGSLTTLFGLYPSQVDTRNTFLPLTLPPSEADQEIEEGTVEPSDTLHWLKTYWPNLDLIAGCPALFSGEFYLPLQQLNRKAGSNFNFMEIMNRALDRGPRDEYDYIIIDTPPSLSYVTMNAYWAADAIVMPVPPEGLDIASSSQFWQLFQDLAAEAESAGGLGKAFHWLNVVPSMVDMTKVHTKDALKWLQAAYGEYLSQARIPETGATNVAAMRLQTVYDIAKYTGSHKTYVRAREAYDRVVDECDHFTRTRVWGESLPEEV